MSKAIRAQTFSKGHTRQELFMLTDYFCPHCGIENVWEGTDADYYQGVDHVCRTCNAHFALPTGVCLGSGALKTEWAECGQEPG